MNFFNQISSLEYSTYSAVGEQCQETCYTCLLCDILKEEYIECTERIESKKIDSQEWILDTFVTISLFEKQRSYSQGQIDYYTFCTLNVSY